MDDSGRAPHLHPAYGNTREAIRAVIDAYEPRIPPRHWNLIAGFVRSVVHDAQPETLARARRMLTDVTRFTHWAVATLGCRLDRNLFEDPLVRQYGAQLEKTRSQRTVGVALADLLDVAQRLRGATNLDATRHVNKKGPASVPYTADEMTRIRSWAAGQRLRQRINATAVVALVAGSGLTGNELIRITTENVEDHGDTGIKITIPQPRGDKTTWCTIPWEPELRWILDHTPPGQFLFRIDSTSRTTNHVSVFLLHHCRRHDIPVFLQRLRATWFVSHLDAGTPLNVLLPAAGITSYTQNLNRYVPHMTPRTPEAAARLLRQRDLHA